MKPTISNYIQPVKEAIPEFSNDSQAWDIAMETLKDTHGMLKGNRLDWMDTAKLKKLVRTAGKEPLPIPHLGDDVCYI